MTAGTDRFKSIGVAKIALQYAKAVIGGKTPAGKYVRQACQRQVNDLHRLKGRASTYRFNPVLTDAAGQQQQE